MIQVVVADHAPALAEIHACSFDAGEAWSAGSLAELLRSPGVWGLADPRGGFVLFRQAADEADVVTLAVLPGVRRQGIAAALLAEGLARLRAVGAASVFLEVAADNLAALALYQRRGFQQVGTRRGYYPGGGDAVLMRLALD